MRRDEKIWPAVNLFELCTVAVTCSYAHVLFLPQFSQETSELSFTELSSHLSILFLCSICSVQDGQAGNNVLRLRLDQSITANTPHYLRMTLGKPKGTVGHGCTERGWTMRTCHKKLHSNPLVMKFFEKVWKLPSTRWCSILFRLFFCCCHGCRSAACHEVKALWGFGMLLPRASSSTRRTAFCRSFTAKTPTSQPRSAFIMASQMCL